MQATFNDVKAAVQERLTKHPSPEDKLSVVKSTPIATLVTSLNAIMFAAISIDAQSAVFYLSWLCGTLAICLFLARKSRLAALREVKPVSKRAARLMTRTAVALAVPTAVLPIYVFGFHGSGEPLFVIVMAAGMAAGGAFILHRAFIAALWYMGTIICLLGLSMHMGDWPQAWAITIYGVIYWMFLSHFAFHFGETAREKDASVGALLQAVQSLEAARDTNFRLANIDDVTGLMNRKAFKERLAQEVARCEAEGSGFTLLMIDLDRFKNVNDLFGHSVGDALLAVIADRLQQALPDGHVVGRLGGDEFSVIVVGVVDDVAIRQVANTVLAELNKPAKVMNHSVHTAASIGAVVCPQDALDPGELLLKADLALNRAKEDGRGQCITFDDTLREKVIASNMIEAGLRDALERERIFIAYQPKISLSDGRVVGAEALVRMSDADGTPVPPDRFLPIAAERGLLPNLSRYISERVAEDIKTWQQANYTIGKIALNIHPDDIKSPEFLMETIDLLEDGGITGDDLSLEITEGCFFGRGTDQATLVLDALAERGFELSLDDFGTGHASLSHLKTIPVNEIKIDRSFVSGIEHRRDDRAIVSAIAEIARGMGIRSVAEGVENAAQLAIIKDLGLDIGQGYFWSRPVKAATFADYLDTKKRSVS